MKKLKDSIKSIHNNFKLCFVKNFKSYYNSGVDAYSRQDYNDAINLFKLAIMQKDIKPQVYYNLALTYQQTKDYNRAITTYNKFLELVPKDYDGLYNLALCYFTQKNYPKAAEFFNKCVDIKKDKDSTKSLILSYLNNDETQKAIEFADNILNSGKNGIELYYEIAKTFEEKNSFIKDFTFIDIAIEMYSKIINIAPDHFESYLTISICFAKKGLWQESIEFCEKAIQKNPKSYEANNQMGLVLYCKNEFDNAIKYYEEAIRLNPKGDFKVYSNLAYAYEKIEKYDKAIKLFTQIVRNFPQSPAKDEIKNHIRILKTL